MKTKDEIFELEQPQARNLAGLSDDALARSFVDQHEKDLRYVAAFGGWMIWKGNVWEPDTTVHVFDLVRQFCRAQSERSQDSRIAPRIASATTIAAVERLARSDRRIAATADQWDQDHWLLNTPAEVVDLRTGSTRTSSRDDYQTKRTSASVGDSCPIWESFLARVTGGDDEFQLFLQRMCGYILTGTTREHALFFLFGYGANGKSVFLNTIAHIMGDYVRTAPIQMLMSSNFDRHPTELAGLQGARLVISSEIDDETSWDESKIKILTGGDRITARRMRQDFVDYIPQFKLVIAGNHRPALRTVDEAMRRRLILLPFTITVPAEERDPALVEKLRAESRGILGWMIEGCKAWQDQGLNPPKIVLQATEAYFSAEDMSDRWIRECCDSRVTTWNPVTKLYESYQEWCGRNRETPYSKRKFSEMLEAKGFQPLRTATARGFRGPSLMTDVTHVPLTDV